MNSSLPIMAKIEKKIEMTRDTVLFTFIPVSASNNFNYTGKQLKSPFTCFNPGQFVQLSLPGAGEMPISYCGTPHTDGNLELCVKAVGRVSSALFNLQVGDNVAINGPFGHGFPLNEFHNNDILLIAGGVGMAPIRSLLLALLNDPQSFGRLTLLHGAREPQALLFAEELWQFHEQGLLSILSVVDSLDNKQNATIYPLCHTGLLPKLIDECHIDNRRTMAALCTPPAAYSAIYKKLSQHGLNDGSIYLSLERKMKCGVGHCGHCAMGTLLCCTDGPVFSVAQLVKNKVSQW